MFLYIYLPIVICNVDLNVTSQNKIFLHSSFSDTSLDITIKF